MAEFTIRFFICNMVISTAIGILLAVKWIFKNQLSSQMHYRLWIILLGMLAIPFIPSQSSGFLFHLQFLSWLKRLWIAPFSSVMSKTEMVMDKTPIFPPSKTANWINNFALSVSRDTPSAVGLLLWGIWIAGILFMLLLTGRSWHRLNVWKQSALPLQNQEIYELYLSCLREMKMKKMIPIYSTAFLKSPVIVGLLRPRIYLPIHLISDHCGINIRYILLHELQHYKRKDTWANIFMNLAGILYWFNPLVWHGLSEMSNDREVACDAAVLDLLAEDAYEDYGNTLINFAETISQIPFAAGISSTMKQMKRRIANIVSYQKPSVWKTMKSTVIFLLTAALLTSIVPFLTADAAAGNRYHWKISPEAVSSVDFSNYFDNYQGSFVLYDSKNHSWQIYNMQHATLRTAPDSTYKIYDALLGLEQGIISPEASILQWNGERYPFDTWNTDQNLHSAMDSSVNWYFQKIDQQLGVGAIKHYVQEIGYGNEHISNDISTYWLESSLKISPVEQVELLIKLYHNCFGFAPEHVKAVKDAICLSSSESRSLHGKTGTGRVNGQDVNGWFIGYVENQEKNVDHTYFFAVNITADDHASGSTASQIALSILSDMDIWE